MHYVHQQIYQGIKTDNLPTVKDAIDKVIEKNRNNPRFDLKKLLDTEIQSLHKTVLFYAVEKKRTSIVEYLLSLGFIDPNRGKSVHINKKKKSSCSPIMEAARKGLNTIISLLLFSGAKCDRKEYSGISYTPTLKEKHQFPLEAAYYEQHAQTVYELARSSETCFSGNNQLNSHQSMLSTLEVMVKKIRDGQRRVKLSNQSIQDCGAHVLGLSIKNSQKTEYSVILSKCNISDNGLSELTDAFKNNNLLEELDLSNNKFTHKGVRSLLNSLSKCKNLKALNLSGLPLGKNFDMLITVIKRQTNRNLSLNLKNCELSGDQIFTLITTLLDLKFTNLQLDLSDNKQSNQDVSNLAFHLYFHCQQNNKLSISHLNLSSARVKPNSLRALVQLGDKYDFTHPIDESTFQPLFDENNELKKNAGHQITSACAVVSEEEKIDNHSLLERLVRVGSSNNYVAFCKKDKAGYLLEFDLTQIKNSDYIIDFKSQTSPQKTVAKLACRSGKMLLTVFEKNTPVNVDFDIEKQHKISSLYINGNKVNIRSNIYVIDNIQACANELKIQKSCTLVTNQLDMRIPGKLTVDGKLYSVYSRLETLRFENNGEITNFTDSHINASALTNSGSITAYANEIMDSIVLENSNSGLIKSQKNLCIRSRQQCRSEGSIDAGQRFYSRADTTFLKNSVTCESLDIAGNNVTVADMTATFDKDSLIKSNHGLNVEGNFNITGKNNRKLNTLALVAKTVSFHKDSMTNSSQGLQAFALDNILNDGHIRSNTNLQMHASQQIHFGEASQTDATEILSISSQSIENCGDIQADELVIKAQESLQTKAKSTLTSKSKSTLICRKMDHHGVINGDELFVSSNDVTIQTTGVINSQSVSLVESNRLAIHGEINSHGKIHFQKQPNHKLRAFKKSKDYTDFIEKWKSDASANDKLICYNPEKIAWECWLSDGQSNCMLAVPNNSPLFSPLAKLVFDPLKLTKKKLGLARQSNQITPKIAVEIFELLDKNPIFDPIKLTKATSSAGMKLYIKPSAKISAKEYITFLLNLGIMEGKLQSEGITCQFQKTFQVFRRGEITFATKLVLASSNQKDSKLTLAGRVNTFEPLPPNEETKDNDEQRKPKKIVFIKSKTTILGQKLETSDDCKFHFDSKRITVRSTHLTINEFFSLNYEAHVVIAPNAKVETFFAYILGKQLSLFGKLQSIGKNIIPVSDVCFIKPIDDITKCKMNNTYLNLALEKKITITDNGRLKSVANTSVQTTECRIDYTAKIKSKQGALTFDVTRIYNGGAIEAKENSITMRIHDFMLHGISNPYFTEYHLNSLFAASMNAKNIQIVAPLFLSVLARLQAKQNISVMTLIDLFAGLNLAWRINKNHLIGLDYGIDCPNPSELVRVIQALISWDFTPLEEAFKTTFSLNVLNDPNNESSVIQKGTNIVISALNVIQTPAKILYPFPGLLLGIIKDVGSLLLNAANLYDQASRLYNKKTPVMMVDVIPLLVGAKNAVNIAVQLNNQYQSAKRQLRATAENDQPVWLDRKSFESKSKLAKNIASEMAQLAFMLFGPQLTSDALFEFKAAGVNLFPYVRRRAVLLKKSMFQRVPTCFQVALLANHDQFYTAWDGGVTYAYKSVVEGNTLIQSGTNQSAQRTVNVTNYNQTASAKFITGDGSVNIKNLSQGGQFKVKTGKVIITEKHTVEKTGELVIGTKQQSTDTAKNSENSTDEKVDQTNPTDKATEPDNQESSKKRSAIYFAKDHANQGKTTFSNSSIKIENNYSVSKGATESINDCDFTAHTTTREGSYSISDSVIKVEENFDTTESSQGTIHGTVVDAKNMKFSGKLNGQKSDFTAEEKIDITDSAQHETKKVGFHGKRIDYKGATLAESDLIFDASELNLYDQGSIQGDNTRLFLTRQQGILDSEIGVENLIFKGDKVDNVNDFVTLTGQYSNISVSGVLALDVDQDVNFNVNGEKLSHGLLLSSNALELQTNFQSDQGMIFKTKVGDIDISNSKLSAEKLAFFSVNRILKKNSTVHSETLLIEEAENSIISKHSTSTGNKVFLESKNGDILGMDGNHYTASTYLQAVAKGDIKAEVGIRYQNAGFVDNNYKKIYDASSFVGGTGEGHDGVGLFVSANGKVINHASVFGATGDVYLSGDKGVEGTADLNKYVYNRYVKRKAGVYRSEHIKTITEINKANFFSGEGKIQMVSKDGMVSMTSANIASRKTALLHGKYGVKLNNMIVEKEHIVNRRLGIKYGGNSIDQQSVPTVVLDPVSIGIKATHGDIAGTDVVIRTRDLYLAVSPEHKVEFKAAKLNHYREETNIGLSVNVLGFDIYNTNGSNNTFNMRTLFNNEPLYGDINNLLHSNNVGEIATNLWNAGMHAYNATAMLYPAFAEGNLSQGLGQRYGLSDGEGFNPTATIGLERTHQQSYFQTLGSGNIMVGDGHVEGGDFIIEGLPVAVKNDLHLNVNCFIQRGVELGFDHQFNRANVSIGVTATGEIAYAGAGYQQQSTHSTRVVNQQFSVGGTTYYNNVAEHQLIGANFDTTNVTGHLDTLYAQSLQDRSRSEGFGFSGNTQGFGSVNYNNTNSNKVRVPTTYHVQSDINDGDNPFQLNHLALHGAGLTSDGQNNIDPQTMVTSSITDHERSHGYGISGNINSFFNRQDEADTPSLPSNRPLGLKPLDTFQVSYQSKNYLAENLATLYGTPESAIYSNDSMLFNNLFPSFAKDGNFSDSFSPRLNTSSPNVQHVLHDKNMDLRLVFPVLHPPANEIEVENQFDFPTQETEKFLVDETLLNNNNTQEEDGNDDPIYDLPQVGADGFDYLLGHLKSHTIKNQTTNAILDSTGMLFSWWAHYDTQKKLNHPHPARRGLAGAAADGVVIGPLTSHPAILPILMIGRAQAAHYSRLGLYNVSDEKLGDQFEKVQALPQDDRSLGAALERYAEEEIWMGMENLYRDERLYQGFAEGVDATSAFLGEFIDRDFERIKTTAVNAWNKASGAAVSGWNITKDTAVKIWDFEMERIERQTPPWEQEQSARLANQGIFSHQNQKNNEALSFFYSPFQLDK